MKDYDQSAASKLASEETEALHIALEPRIAFDAALAAEALEAAESVKDQIEPPSRTRQGMIPLPCSRRLAMRRKGQTRLSSSTQVSPIPQVF